MLYIFGPSLALNIDKSVQLRFFKVDHHVGRLIALLIEKWIIFCFNPCVGKILYRSNVLFVRIVLAFAGDLYVAWRKRCFLRIANRASVVRLGSPAVDLFC